MFGMMMMIGDWPLIGAYLRIGLFQIPKQYFPVFTESRFLIFDCLELNGNRDFDK